jgi:hypothetical protein
MISDAYIDITCDNCLDSSQIELEYKHTDYSGNNGYYDSSDSAVKSTAEAIGYIFDGENHYCCAECHKESGAKDE